MGQNSFMFINMIVKSIVKSIIICLSDTDNGIDFMIPILSDTFNTVYSPNLLATGSIHDYLVFSSKCYFRY